MRWRGFFRFWHLLLLVPLVGLFIGAPDLVESKHERFRALLAKEGYEPPTSFYLAHYDTFGPAVMRDVLHSDRYCHAKGHNLGRAIYERMGDFAAATQMCGSTCSAGCIHGVLMAFYDTEKQDLKSGEHVDIDDLTPELRDRIAGSCVTSEITRYTGVGNCYHAVGHGLMSLADYDVSAGVHLCDIFAPYGDGAVYYCATGAYMERDIVHGEADVTAPDGYPCTGPYPAACYRYKLRRQFELPREATTVHTWCAARPEREQAGCFHGLGFGGNGLVYNDATKLSLLCDTADLISRRLCWEGALGFIAIHDRNKAIAACDHVDDAAACLDAVKVENFGMNRDFSLYTR